MAREGDLRDLSSRTMEERESLRESEIYLEEEEGSPIYSPYASSDHCGVEGPEVPA